MSAFEVINWLAGVFLLVWAAWEIRTWIAKNDAIQRSITIVRLVWKYRKGDDK